jgi:hypothetical protein
MRPGVPTPWKSGECLDPNFQCRWTADTSPEAVQGAGTCSIPDDHDCYFVSAAKAMCCPEVMQSLQHSSHDRLSKYTICLAAHVMCLYQ